MCYSGGACVVAGVAAGFLCRHNTHRQTCNGRLPRHRRGRQWHVQVQYDAPAAKQAHTQARRHAACPRLAARVQKLTFAERVTSQPENPYARLIPDQTFAIIPEVRLESGVVLQEVSVAYKTYGRLSPARDNAMVICHALTGSADVGDWWGPLLGGPGKAFDTSRFFVVCMNSLGSPYGSASPVTARDGDVANGRYGPEFPLTTVRDDVK